MNQKKLLQDASRNSRSNRMQILKHLDKRPSMETIKDVGPNNSTMQESITETKEEASILGPGNRTLKASIDLSIGGISEDILEGWAHQRGPVIRQRGSYLGSTTEEERAKKGESSRKKRVRGYAEPDGGKLISRQVRLQRDQYGERGSVSVVPATRYHVVRNESRPSNLER